MTKKKFFMLEDGKILCLREGEKKNTHLGTFTYDDKKVITSSIGKKAFLYFPSIKDVWNIMERGPQVMHYKDVSFIISSLQVRESFDVIEIGGGSGYFTISFLKLFGNRLKKYIIFEKSEKNANLIKRNIEVFLGKEVYKKVSVIVEEFNENTEISEKFNLAIVDIPYNFNVLKKVGKYMDIGGEIFFYILNLDQLYNLIKDFEKVKDNFILDLFVEVHLRNWIVKESPLVIRPENFELSHTGWILKFIKNG